MVRVVRSLSVALRDVLGWSTERKGLRSFVKSSRGARRDTRFRVGKGDGDMLRRGREGRERGRGEGGGAAGVPMVLRGRVDHEVGGGEVRI